MVSNPSATLRRGIRVFAVLSLSLLACKSTATKPVKAPVTTEAKAAVDMKTRVPIDFGDDGRFFMPPGSRVLEPLNGDGVLKGFVYATPTNDVVGVSHLSLEGATCAPFLDLQEKIAANGGSATKRVVRSERRRVAGQAALYTEGARKTGNREQAFTQLDICARNSGLFVVVVIGEGQSTTETDRKLADEVASSLR